jgi:TM2 domain-containing membrane protein YozV
VSDSQEYQLRWRGRQSGPYPVNEINRMLDDHEIGMGHEILYNEKWITLEEFFTTLEKAATAATAQPQKTVTRVPLAFSTRSPQPEKDSAARVKVSTEAAAAGGHPRYRLLFAFLALVAGYVGAHNFYARQWMTGLLQLLLSVATFLMGFGIIASWLWAMVEALVVRRDGDGIEMI